MKCCIIDIFRGYNNIDKYNMLITRNELLYKNYVKQFPCDVIICHEGNIVQEHQKYLQSKTNMTLSFVDIKSLGMFNINFDTKNSNALRTKQKLLYLFYIKYLPSFINDYDYYWKLGEDCYVLSKIEYNVFDFMHKKNIEHGFVYKKNDSHSLTIKTFPGFVEKYKKENNIRLKFNPINHYYNNFYITKLDFWHRKDVQNFIDAVLSSKGIEKYRWGDHVIQSSAIDMFANKQSLHMFRDIVYYHKSHDKLIYDGKVIN